MNSVYIAFLSFGGYLLYRVIQWRLRLAKVRRTMPAVGVISEPWAIWRRFWPGKWQTYHNEWQFQDRKSFDNHGSDILPLICLFGKDVYYLFDADAIVEVSMDAVRFPKDLELYQVLNIYGRNILTVEGQEWRLHRKITSRPFSEKNNQLVHEETVRQTTQMMAAWEEKAKDGTVRVDSVTEDTFKIALHVITGAGFGVPFTWKKSSDEVWPKHTLSFRDAVSNLVNNLLPLVILPKIVRQLPVQSLRTVEEAYGEFGTYLREILAREKDLSMKGKDHDSHPNLLSALVKHAAMVEEGGVTAAMTDQEIIGNTFIFLVAGHETTARSLFYAFVMLAMDPALQDTLVADIKQTIGDRIPTYDDYPNLVLPLCVQFETLRMFPPVVTIPKLCPQDTLVNGKYHIPRNVTLVFDTVHTHRNPKYWDDVDTFNPSRFDGRNAENPTKQEIDTGDTSPGGHYDKIKIPQKGAFCPFSEGSRSCLGRKFTQVEFVACLVMILREWKIELCPDWSEERVWGVLDKSFTTLTLGPPEEVPLVFRKR